MKYLLLFLLCMAGCRKKEPVEQRPDILSVREMGNLATVEYTVTKIIKTNDNKAWYTVGDRKILMSCEAHIKAGVNLSGLTENNFTITGKNIEVRLPLPGIVSLNIPPENIKTEYQQTGFFRDPFKNGERDALAAQAEQQIRNSVGSLGILTQAKANTALFVSNFLRQAGYRNIQITWYEEPMKTQAP